MKVLCLAVMVCALMAVTKAVSVGGILSHTLVTARKGKEKALKQKAGKTTLTEDKVSVKETLLRKKGKVEKLVDVEKLRSDVTTVPATTKADIAAIAKRQDSFNTALHLSFTVVTMILSRMIYKLDYKNPKLVLYCRVAFCSYIVLSQVLFWLLRQMVLRQDDRTLLPLSAAANPMQALAGLMGGPSSGGGGLMAGMLGSLLGSAAGGVGSQLTVKEYDLAQVQKLSSGMLFELLVASYMHLVVKNTAQLLMVPLMGLSGKIRAPIVQIHLLRMKPVGQLARPFKSGLESILGKLKGPLQGQGPVVGAGKVDAGKVAASLPEASIESQASALKTSKGKGKVRAKGSDGGSDGGASGAGDAGERKQASGEVEVVDLDDESADVSAEEGVAAEVEESQQRGQAQGQQPGQGLDSAELLDAIDRLGELELD